MSDPEILVERRDEYAVVTLNRPAKRNAVSVAMASLLDEELTRLDDVKVVVVTGAGDRAFCAGMDLGERDQRIADTAWRDTRRHFWFRSLELIRHHPAVFIAAVNGFAVGGGLTLVNTCELAVASETAEFGMPELGLGSFPSLAGPSTIRRVLPKRAAQLILTARRIDAGTAEAWGIVNSVAPPQDLLSEACALARHISQFDQTALRAAKKAIRELAPMEWSAAIDYGLTTTALIRKNR